MSQVRIGQVLLQAGLITEDELKEALTAQQIYGGRLGTVLVEHDFVDEDELAEALARLHGMRRVSREHLSALPASVIKAVPLAVATRFQVVPFSIDEARNLVWLAVPDPADLSRQDEMRFALGRAVELALAPEILLKRALAKYYGLPHERRFIKLHTAGSGRRRRREVSAASTVLDAPQMLRLLAEASSQSAVLERSLDCLASFAEDVSLLTVDGQGLVGWGRRTAAATAGDLSSVRISFDEAPEARQLMAARTAVMLDAGVGAALHALLCGQLGLDRRGRIAVLALASGDRTIGCYVLGRYRQGRPFDPALVAELVMRVSWRMQALHLMDCVLAPILVEA